MNTGKLLQAIEADRCWSGPLTEETYKAVAMRLRRMLAGKLYTFVADNGLRGGCPEVRTNQRLTGSNSGAKAGDASHVSICDDADKPHGFVICDTYGIAGLWAEKAGDDPWDWHKTPQVHFEWDQWVSFRHAAPCGNELWWVLAVQGPLPEEDDR